LEADSRFFFKKLSERGPDVRTISFTNEACDVDEKFRIFVVVTDVAESKHQRLKQTFGVFRVD
jgi:hypothetical protein